MSVQQRINELYKNDRAFFYVLGALGTFMGMNICNHFFFDETKQLKLRQEIETEYWKEHGEPKYLKP